ncbi:MAG: hypothetical protein ABI939_02110, partial [Anaerolineaceae bacterium]
LSWAGGQPDSAAIILVAATTTDGDSRTLDIRQQFTATRAFLDGQYGHGQIEPLSWAPVKWKPLNRLTHLSILR